MSSDLFRSPNGNRAYALTRSPYMVLFARDMGKGTFRQRLQMTRQYQELRRFITEEWAFFCANAERNFADNFAKEFWPGWFELRCSGLLRSKGLVNEATGGGPDFVVSEKSTSTRFALEATILTPGNGGASSVATFDAPEQFGKFVINDVSDQSADVSAQGKHTSIKNVDSQWNMSLRVTNTLENKRKQIERWVKSGVVDSTMPIVVAISPTHLETETNRSFYNDDLERALYGKGHQIVKFQTNVNSLEKDAVSEHQQARAMENNSGAAVNLGVFLNPVYSSISAVLLIQDSLFLSSSRGTHLYINPLASNVFVDTPKLGDQLTSFVDGMISTKNQKHGSVGIHST